MTQHKGKFFGASNPKHTATQYFPRNILCALLQHYSMEALTERWALSLYEHPQYSCLRPLFPREEAWLNYARNIILGFPFPWPAPCSDSSNLPRFLIYADGDKEHIRNLIDHTEHQNCPLKETTTASPRIRALQAISKATQELATAIEYEKLDESTLRDMLDELSNALLIIKNTTSSASSSRISPSWSAS